MKIADKLKMVDALVEIKLALNEMNNIIDNHNVNCVNDANLLDYKKCASGFTAVDQITQIIKSL